MSSACPNMGDGGRYVLYQDRPDWSDLKPIAQDDGPYPVVKIAYSKAFVDVYDYFRGVVAVGEVSERALELTEDAISMNAANYTVWQYRRRILQHLNSNLRDELDFCREMIEANPKNYQVWHHRRVVVSWLRDGSKELRLTQIVFSQDAKNYHAWEHRQWTLRTFNLYEGELEFIEGLLRDDIRNNSAWNQRYFVLSRTVGFTIDVLRAELRYIYTAIGTLQNNESPWAYMKGLLQDTIGDDDDIDACWKETEEFCWALYNNSHVASGISGGSSDPTSATNTIIADCVGTATSGLTGSCAATAADGADTRPIITDFTDRDVVSGGTDSATTIPGADSGCVINDFSDSLGGNRSTRADVRKSSGGLKKHRLSHHVVVGLYDCVMHRLERVPDDQDNTEPLNTAVQLLESLASTHDKIRYRYWNFLKRELLAAHSRRPAAASCAADSSAACKTARQEKQRGETLQRDQLQVKNATGILERTVNEQKQVKETREQYLHEEGQDIETREGQQEQDKETGDMIRKNVGIRL